jgi:hypothetical protein
VRLVGLALIVKSTALTPIVIEWVSSPLVPVTVTEYEPAAVALSDMVVETCWLGATLIGLLFSDDESPVEDEMERLIVPVNPLKLVTVICEEDGTPAWICKEEGPLK